MTHMSHRHEMELEDKDGQYRRLVERHQQQELNFNEELRRNSI